MPDASEHSLPYIEQAGIKFGKLSVTERSRLLRDYKASARAALDQDITATALSQEQAWAERRAFSQDIWGAFHWHRYINEWDGQEAILRVALAKQNPPEQVDALLGQLVLTPAETIELACKLTGVPYEPAAPRVPNMQQVGVMDGKPIYAPVAEGADGANPTATATTDPAQTEATTEQTPPKRQGFGT